MSAVGRAGQGKFVKPDDVKSYDEVQAYYEEAVKVAVSIGMMSKQLEAQLCRARTSLENAKVNLEAATERKYLAGQMEAAMKAGCKPKDPSLLDQIGECTGVVSSVRACTLMCQSWPLQA